MAEKPFVVGLTGQTGAGKTTVSEAFRKNGYAVINADLVSREVTADPYVTKRLGELFGADVLREDGTLDRKVLGNKVFSDPNELLKLNTVLHPMIVKRIEEMIETLAQSGQKRILLDAPTLFESGANRLCDKTLAVLADEELRKKRIMERDGLTEAEALRRIKAQHPASYYRTKSSFTLRNNGTAEQLEKDAQPLIDRLEKSKNSIARSMATLTAGFVASVLIVWGLFLGAFLLQYPKKYEPLVMDAAAEFQVSPALLYSIMKIDSGLKADYAEDGEQGIFPLTEEEFVEIRGEIGGTEEYSDLLTPETGVRYGAAYLKSLTDAFPAERSAIAANYAGEEQTAAWLADPAYSENGVDLTEIPDKDAARYVTKVEGALFMYEKLYKLD